MAQRRTVDGRSVKSGRAGGWGDRVCTAVDEPRRGKEYPTTAEMTALLDAAKAGRHGVRDHLLMLMMQRHGLRASEAVDLCCDELDLDRWRMWVHRPKGGLAVEHHGAGHEG